MHQPFRSGDALFAFDRDLRVVSWNEEAALLTGVPAADAVGRACWEVLGGQAEDGAVVCHAGCSGARLAREGYPVPCQRLAIRTSEGRKLVWVSTVGVGEGPEQLTLHLMRNGAPAPRDGSRPVPLTARQREVLEHLARGAPAKVIAAQLGVTQVTVRNHIQAVLRALGSHSQLEAVAEARRRGIV